MDYSHVVLLFALLLVYSMCTAKGQEMGFSDSYYGHLNGTPAKLVIGQEDDRLSGTLDTEGYIYTLEGTAADSSAGGVITDQKTGGAMSFHAQLDGDTLTMTIENPSGSFVIPFRRGAQANITDQTSTEDNADRDSRLPGFWATQVNVNTPDGTLSTQIFMEIRADGTLIDLGSRATGSFPGAGINNGLEGGEDTMAWRTQQNVLYVSHMGNQWVPLAQYELSGNRLLLMYYDGSRQLWHRQ